VKKKFTVILGGTFDPIHLGHLQVARFAFNDLHADVGWLMPCGQHADKDPSQVSFIKHRKNMIDFALKDLDHWLLQDIELCNPNKSYTLDTLKALHQVCPDHQFAYLMGQDVMQSIENWDDWQEIIDYCHVVIVNRGCIPLAESVPVAWENRLTSDWQALHKQDSGLLYLLHMPTHEASATFVRNHMDHQDQNDQDVVDMLQPEVMRYIKEHKLFT
jgi:nicotinate-nucleotide adenylyltransferase